MTALIRCNVCKIERTPEQAEQSMQRVDIDYAGQGAAEGSISTVHTMHLCGHPKQCLAKWERHVEAFARKFDAD